MDNLQAQLNRIQAQIAQEKAKGAAERNDAKIAQLEQDEADILAQMDEAKKQAQDAAIEEKVHAESVPFAIEGVDFTQLPAELITVIELVVKADRRRIYAEHAEELEKAQKESENAISGLQFNIDTLNGIIEHGTADNKRLIRENGDLRDHTSKQKLEIDDLTSKLANAAAQLDESKAEIERLKSQIDDYQKAKVFGERDAQNVIEAEPQEADAINEALKKLYVSIENWGSTNKVVKPDGSFELVKNKDLDEWSPITPPQLGGAESADSFRGEDTEADAKNDQLSATEEAENVDSFPIPVQNNLDTVDRDTAVQKVVGETETVTRAEFEALKERVNRLENGIGGAAA